MNISNLMSKPDIDMTVIGKLNKIALSAGRKNSNSDKMQKQVVNLLDSMAQVGQLENAIRTMLYMTGADAFLPPQYEKFQTVVFEGAVFFVSKLPRQRIAQKMTEQLCLPMDTPTGKRMCHLVTNLPTLQKLCQIICRSPGLDPVFKSFLIDLEDNSGSLAFKDLQNVIKKGINKTGSNSKITLSKKILAEASVSAVIPGRIKGKNVKDSTPIVLKIVKPEIRQNMKAELELWGTLGEYLDANKKKWGLGDFKFKGIIDQVSWLLQNEIDLGLEQKNLDKLKIHFSKDDTVLIPERLAISTPDITAMTRIDGRKITDVDHLSPRQRRRIARKIANLCILRPIIDLTRESIFHGDPHAGNMAYIFKGRKPKIVFYDWAMVGTLSRLERFAVLFMITGLVFKNETAVYYAADIMCKGQITRSETLKKNVTSIIQEMITNREKRLTGVLSSVENLIESLMYEGLIFSADLLVFEKSLVTLKGVLADIDPEFSRDEYIVFSAVYQLMNDFAHLRIQKMILKELWTLYRFSLSTLFNVQRAIFRLTFSR